MGSVAGIDAMGRLMGSLGLAVSARRRQTGDMDGLDEAALRCGGPPAALQPLLQSIDEAGEALSRDPSGQLLDNYRGLLRELLDRAMKENTHLGSEQTLGLSQRIFQTVTRTDMALAELTDAVLGRQKDLLRVKSIVLLLKGLIVDLYR